MAALARPNGVADGSVVLRKSCRGLAALHPLSQRCSADTFFCLLQWFARASVSRHLPLITLLGLIRVESSIVVNSRACNRALTSLSAQQLQSKRGYPITNRSSGCIRGVGVREPYCSKR